LQLANAGAINLLDISSVTECYATSSIEIMQFNGDFTRC